MIVKCAQLPQSVQFGPLFVTLQAYTSANYSNAAIIHKTNLKRARL
ncbi:MAG: hypothetical protein RI942_330 [Pseudomonadota bacterium]|jgi:hypothetical protein